MTNIYFVGTGVSTHLHLTEESKQALTECDVLLVLHPDYNTHSYLFNFCKSIINLEYMYEGEEERLNVYKKISELIVEEANKGKKVAFVTHGHPLFLVSATEYTMELADKNNLSYKIIPGISSFDTILAELKIDYGYALQMYCANSLLRNEYSINCDVPLILFQLATVNTSKIIADEVNISELSRLKSYLLNYYDENRECKFITCSRHYFEKDEIVLCKLKDLDNVEQVDLSMRPSLVIE